MTTAATEPNRDEAVIRDFGREWRRFDQTTLSHGELEQMFAAYFDIFPWHELPPAPVGFDLGCGSGRWARFVALRLTEGELHCIDPSPALEMAADHLVDFENCRFHRAAADSIPLADGSADFGYSLGVLHHLPDTAAGLRACVAKLRPGAPFLLYLYYAFDNRPGWFRGLWRASELARHTISRAPARVKDGVCDLIAATVYWPLARWARFCERRGWRYQNLPLSLYRHRSFYVMRNDALDRFGTRLEKRFTRAQIEAMMREAGLERIRFSEQAPYWCALGYRAAS